MRGVREMMTTGREREADGAACVWRRRGRCGVAGCTGRDGGERAGGRAGGGGGGEDERTEGGGRRGGQEGRWFEEMNGGEQGWGGGGGWRKGAGVGGAECGRWACGGGMGKKGLLKGLAGGGGGGGQGRGGRKQARHNREGGHREGVSGRACERG